MSFESWNSPLFAAKFIHFKGKIAAQTDKKSREKTKSRKETEQPGGFGASMTMVATTARGGLWPQCS